MLVMMNWGGHLIKRNGLKVQSRICVAPRSFSSSRRSQQLLQRQQEQKVLDKERDALLAEARAMTNSLFRICLRSTKLLREGNEHDEKMFRALEEKQLDELSQGILPNTPPVDRVNELNSRADYYIDVARERIWRSATCFDSNPLKEEGLEEYMHFLKQGDLHRQWVLTEYQFPDPFPNVFDVARADAFEKRCSKYLSAVARMTVPDEDEYGCSEMELEDDSDDEEYDEDSDEEYDEDELDEDPNERR